MSNFLSLAFEPFASIIFRLNYPDVVALWICGDLKLQWRLSKGKAVRKIEIQNRLPKVACWPPLVVHFDGLESFGCSPSLDGEESFLSSLQLSTLPQNLKEMSFSTIPDTLAVNHFISTHPSHFSNLSVLKLGSFPENSGLKFKLPQTLHTLHLGSWNYPLSLFQVKTLPQHLVEFQGYLKVMDTNNGEAKFPETLLRIFLSLKVPISFLHLLPSHLESLRYYSPPSNTDIVEDWSEFSRFSLKTLVLSRRDLYDFFDKEQASMLPRTLETLEVRHIKGPITPEWTIGVLEMLPKSLTILRGIFPSIIPLSVVQRLPKSLIWLNPERVVPNALSEMPQNTKIVHLPQNCDISQISVIPPSLKSITLPSLSDHLLSLLPDSLIGLMISDDHVQLTESQINLLPRKLGSLTVRSRNVVPIEDVEHLKGLPPSLEQCNIKSIGLRSTQSTIKCSASSFHHLPRHLNDLSIGLLRHIEPEWLAELPKSLTILDLSCESISSSSFPSLVDFPHLLSFSLLTFGSPDDKWQYCLYNLPPRIQSLEIQVKSDVMVQTNLTNSSFTLVPKSIRSIVIPPSAMLDNSCHTHLPNLRHLGFSVVNNAAWFSKPFKRASICQFKETS